MKKMPPLPNRRTVRVNNLMELTTNKITIPHRYNSIERVIRQTKLELSTQKKEKANDTVIETKRINAFMRRPVSARQISADRSVNSMKSRDSKQSLDSRDEKRSLGKAIPIRQSPHYNRKMRVSMPSITAHSWVLYEMKEQKFICGKSNFKKREIASLTKIMNLITILHLLQIYALLPSKIRVNISRQACTMIGTTAQLKPGIQLSLQDLFYGMMLPSGNDAAHQIAQIGGALIHIYRDIDMDKSMAYNGQVLSKFIEEKGDVVGVYLHEMNNIARKLGLSRTVWANPHGLSNIYNVSTAEDVAKLTMFGMKNNIFREIVNTRYYNCLYYEEIIHENGNRQITKNWIKWENTNKMLLQGWNGVKTGITPNAGPCLAASVQRNLKGRMYEFLVVLLNSESMQARWKQVQSLVDWISNDTAYA